MTSIDSQSTCSGSFYILTRHPRKLCTNLDSVGQLLAVIGAAFLVIGVTATVLGFILVGERTGLQLALWIVGPTCVTTAVVVWVVGCVLSRHWRMELERRKHAVDLRDRVLLHAFAIDVLKQPALSSGILRDPKLRQDWLHQLRLQQTALDLNCSTRSTSRRSSCLSNATSKRRHSVHNLPISHNKPLLNGGSQDRATPLGTGGHHNQQPLPGIHISCIDSLDIDDDDDDIRDRGRKSKDAGNTIRRCIFIKSDESGEVCQISYTSEYSLSGVGGGGGVGACRSSRGSSCYSSRIFDFSSPGRESEWDVASHSVGSRDSCLHQSHHPADEDQSGDWPCSGPSACSESLGCTGGVGMFLSPRIGRRRRSPVVVSFDVAAVDAPVEVGRGQLDRDRRHSSPADHCEKIGVIFSRDNADENDHKNRLNRLNSPPSDRPSSFQLLAPPKRKLASTLAPPSTRGASWEEHVLFNFNDNQYERRTRERTRQSFDTARLNVCGDPIALDLGPCTARLSPKIPKTVYNELGQRLDELLFDINYSVIDGVDESKIKSQEFEPLPQGARDDIVSTHFVDVNRNSKDVVVNLVVSETNKRKNNNLFVTGEKSHHKESILTSNSKPAVVFPSSIVGAVSANLVRTDDNHYPYDITTNRLSEEKSSSLGKWPSFKSIAMTNPLSAAVLGDSKTRSSMTYACSDASVFVNGYAMENGVGYAVGNTMGYEKRDEVGEGVRDGMVGDGQTGCFEPDAIRSLAVKRVYDFSQRVIQRLQHLGSVPSPSSSDGIGC